MKKLFLITMALLFAGMAFAQPRLPFHQVQIVDERGVTVTSITSVEIYAPDTTTNAVIYNDRALNNVMTVPITEASTNTTLVDGVLSWYGPDGYDFSITDGTNIATNADHRTRTASEGTLVFPSYITAISSTTYSDAQSATWGTSGDWVQRGGNVNDQLSFTPLNDNANFIIGVSGTALNSDFNVYVGTALGLKVDAGTPSLIWDGGVVTLNASSNFSVGLCTGTSTGAVTLGSSTAGTITLDTTAGISVTADDSYALAVTAGTVDIDSTGGDMGFDATDKSILIDAGESATDAIIIQATGGAGGVELICGTGDITLDSGDDIFLEADTGTGDVISIINTQGTASGAVILRAVAAGGDVNVEAVAGRIELTGSENTANAVLVVADGGASSTVKIHADEGTGDESIFLDSDLGGITLNANAGSIDIEAVGAGDGDIGINSGDDMTLTTAGKLTITNTEPVTVSGTLTPVAVNIVDFVITDQASVTLVGAQSGKILTIADLGQNTTIDLPVEVDGMNFEFWYVGGATEVHDHIIDSESNTNYYIGGLQFMDSDDNTITEVYSDGDSNSILTLNNLEAGSIVKITCNGVQWFITGIIFSDTAPTFGD